MRAGRVIETRVDVHNLANGRAGFFDREGCTILSPPGSQPLRAGEMKRLFAKLRDARRDFINGLVAFGVEAGRMARRERTREAA